MSMLMGLLLLARTVLAETPISGVPSPAEIPLDPDDATIGAADARFTVVEWMDFECPHCAAAFPKIAKYVADHPDTRVVFKNYPISGTCNPAVQGARHEHACTAARAGICASEQGKFEPMARQMFGNQQFLGDSDLAYMADKIGLDPDKYDTCMKKGGAAGVIARHVKEAVPAKIEGTPTIDVRGPWGARWVRVDGLDSLFAAIDAARSGAPLPEPTAE
jgi:protein-disulfide isomerase